VLDEFTDKKKGVRDDWRHCIKDLVMTLRDSMDRTYNHRLDLGPTMDEHAHPMSSRLIKSTVVGQNERKIRRTFICIRKKVPLLLGLKMDLVGTGAETAKLRDDQLNIEQKWRELHTCFGESSAEEVEDD
jgi:hypothetical protein